MTIIILEMIDAEIIQLQTICIARVEVIRQSMNKKAHDASEMTIKPRKFQKDWGATLPKLVVNQQEKS